MNAYIMIAMQGHEASTRYLCGELLTALCEIETGDIARENSAFVQDLF